MEYENDTPAVNFLTGLIFGVVIGAGVALLMAPESGRRTRRRITRAAGDFRDHASDRWDDLASDLKLKVDDAVQSAKQRLPAG